MKKEFVKASPEKQAAAREFMAEVQRDARMMMACTAAAMTGCVMPFCPDEELALGMHLDDAVGLMRSEPDIWDQNKIGDFASQATKPGNIGIMLSGNEVGSNFYVLALV
jgi:hypothetical protein